MSHSTTFQPTLIHKRDGRLQRFDARKVEYCLLSLSWGLYIGINNIRELVVALQLRLPTDTMTAETFLVFLAETVSTFSSRHPDFSILAGRVYTIYHHKRVSKCFSSWVLSFENATPPVFTDALISVVRQHADVIDGAIMHARDFEFTYRALHIFERSYLLKDGCELAERLQFLFMRVAIGIHGRDLPDVLETYELLSTRRISFASPTLWNGGLVNRHFASCYTYEPSAVDAEAIVGNFSSLSTLWATDGGVGLSVSDVPAVKTGSSGHPGLMPLLKVYDALASFWSRSSRHRSSSATAYLPIWHSDVRRFVLCRTNRALKDYRFRNIFPGLWIPNLFMHRLEEDKMWSLFDPGRITSLSDLYGDAFETAYLEYERLGLASGTIRARVLWDVVTDAIRDTGAPFLMYSDNVNARNNQMNLGVIKSGNLCSEIVQYSSTLETAVCTLASVCLPRYIRGDGTFDYQELHRVVKLVVRGLDRLIDNADFPTANAAVSALRTRSLGVGVQGLADLFAIMELPFSSVEARVVNRRVFETIYHAALESSNELAETFGPHDAWDGSPAQQGILQVDMWEVDTSNHFDFVALRERIGRTGLRNSVLTAQMPTASTAQLFGNSEGIDPPISNIIQFRVLSGNFNEISRSLVMALQQRGLWTDELREKILESRGSVQSVPGVPDDVKSVFKTAFELDPHVLVDMAAERAPFIDQSQSLTLFVSDLTSLILMDLQLHAWRSGLKTGAYYVRTMAAADPQPFGVGRKHSKGEPSTSIQKPDVVPVTLISCPCDG